MHQDENLAKAGAYDEYNKWVRHNAITGIVTVLVALVTFHLVWPLHIGFVVKSAELAAAGAGRLELVGGYFSDLWSVLSFQNSYRWFFGGYYFAWFKAIKSGEVPFSIAWTFWLGIVFVTAMTGMLLNTHRKTPNIYGDARWATLQDLKAMSRRNLVGLDKALFVVGKFDKQLIRMGETLSVLLLAPPGCQPSGSRVRLADGSEKPIEEIAIDDVVVSPTDLGGLESARVKRLITYEDKSIVSVRAIGAPVGYRCSDNHVLTYAEPSPAGLAWRDLPVRDFLELPEDQRSAAKVGVWREDGSVQLLPFEVTSVGQGRVHGFELEGPSQRYLTDHAIATHNTGKSVGFIVPSAVSMDKACLFFHDQKPELFDMTSGHRASVGPVFQLKWSAQDEPNGTWLSEEQVKLTSPDLLERDASGNPVRDDAGRYKTLPIFYPSWNPLSPKSIPGPGPRRDLYLERLANVLCPDSGSDKFWTSKARAALIGLASYLVAKFELAGEPGNEMFWKGIPDHWQGREACFPALVDWFAWAQMEFDDGSDDPMRSLFKAALDEAKKMDEIFTRRVGQPVLNRAINEITNLMNSPDKTRGSILQTLDDGLAAFKNEAVRQRTSTSDFAFYELRGMPTAEAKAREMAKVQAAKAEGKIYKPRYKKTEYLPISIYVSVNTEDAKAMAPITGIFVDAANAALIANGPNAIDDQGNQYGPFDYIFMLDEAPQLPKLDTIVNGPSVGRSKRVSYIIVGQDFGQFEQKYSKPEVDTLKSTTAIKLILSQNNETSAEQISKMAGKVTIKKHSLSEKSAGKDPISFLFPGKSASESWDQVDFLKPGFIMSMPENKHVVMVQNYMTRPILADTPKFWLEKDINKKVYNLREFTGPPPALPMPADTMAAAARAYAERQAMKVVATERREALDDPRHVIIATPRDIQSLTRDAFGEMMDRPNVFACAAVKINKDECFFDLPEPEEILVTDRVEDIVAFIGKSRYFVFDEVALEEEVNSKLRLAGETPLATDFAEYVTRRAVDVGETPGNDIYYLGYQGGAALDLPDGPDRVTPQFTVRWIADVITFIMGIEEQKRMFEL
mgnify:CR=1 FL=1